MRDALGREISYMRLSVTDRCNLRCRYCMPMEGVPPTTHGDILRYEELLRVAQAAVSLGIDRFKVTGGEPLVRRGIVDFIRSLKALPGVRQVTLTTNGLHLHARRAGAAHGAHRFDAVLLLVQDERDLAFREVQPVAQRDEVGGVLGRHDARNLRHAEYVALFRRAASHGGKAVRAHRDAPGSDRSALGGLLFAHIHHHRVAVCINMSKLHCK